MEKIINVAAYIFDEYKRITKEVIDEMKLQKLLYFSQRETLAILNRPLFKENFEGWKYGSVSKKVIPYDYVWDMYYDEFEDYEEVIQ